MPGGDPEAAPTVTNGGTNRPVKKLSSDNSNISSESTTTDNVEDEEGENNPIVKPVPRTRFIYPSACQSDISDNNLIRDPTFGWEEDSLSVPEDSSLYTSLYTRVSGFLHILHLLPFPPYTTRETHAL